MVIRVRQARADDWPAMWRIMQPVIAAADTFSWDPQLPEAFRHPAHGYVGLHVMYRRL
jgi:hypothetical protein